MAWVVNVSQAMDVSSGNAPTQKRGVGRLRLKVVQAKGLKNTQSVGSQVGLECTISPIKVLIAACEGPLRSVHFVPKKG